mmetsp:Transcript_84120/g.242867  ORF Transcript_84120/g.242867 Transcript_84120/m.242867 type:complete len:430 (+) Transcript_84120:85-1374(+)
MEFAEFSTELPAAVLIFTSLSISAGSLFFLFATRSARRTQPKQQEVPNAGEPIAESKVRGESVSGADTTAAFCLSQDYGRFKHCGLRENPYDPRAAPPKYSLVNLDLPLPEIGESDRRALDELIERVRDMQSRMMRTDAATMLRFLRARKGNVAAAEAYFRKACDLRERLGLVRMEIDWDLETYEHCFAPWWTRGGLIGCGKKGQIIGFERFGRCHFPDIVRDVPWEILERLDAVHLVRTLAAMEELSMRRGQNVFGDAILILDMEGVGWEYCNLSVARLYGKLVENRDMLCPCTLSNIFCIRAPKAFSMAWNMFKNVLDPVTRDKVSIVSGDEASLRLLREFIDDDVIPGYLGGKAHNGGDPQCPLLLGTPNPGPPPRDAVEQLLRMASGQSPKTRVRRRSRKLGDLDMSEEQSNRGCWAGFCLAFGR